ncbi:MAG: DNA gyrase inhibitor YacG [Caldimonas sp.]
MDAIPYRIVRCPGCGGDSVYAASNAWRPFCSARCRGTDLGAWSSEDYRVAARPDPGDDEAPPLPDRD